MDWAGDRLNGDPRRTKRLANVAAADFRAARAEGEQLSRPARGAGVAHARFVLGLKRTVQGKRLDHARGFRLRHLGQPYTLAADPGNSVPVVFLHGSAMGKTTEAVFLGVDVGADRIAVSLNAPGGALDLAGIAAVHASGPLWPALVQPARPASRCAASACPCDAGRPGVACPQQADPPVGTPHVSSPRGNSAPASAPVAGPADWLNHKVEG